MESTPAPSSAESIDEKRVTIVDVGRSITLLFNGDSIEDAERYEIVEPWNKTSRSQVQTDSALGQAVLGKEAGVRVSFPNHDGELVTVKIVAVE